MSAKTPKREARHVGFSPFLVLVWRQINKSAVLNKPCRALRGSLGTFREIRGNINNIEAIKEQDISTLELMD